MKKLFYSIVFVLPLLTLVSCDASDSSDRAEELSGKWSLNALKLDGEKVDLGKTNKVWIDFKRDQISGNGGCNSYGGTFTLDEDRLTFTELAWTEMASLDQAVMKLENQYLQAIGQVKKFTVNDKELILTDTDGKIEIAFVPFQETKGLPLTGTQWTLQHFEEVDGEGDAASVSATKVLDSAPITLKIERGRANGNAGVNMYGSAVETDDATISFKTPISTKRAGPPEAMQQETLYLATLVKMTKYSIKGKQLTLSNEDGSVSLVYSGKE